MKLKLLLSILVAANFSLASQVSRGIPMNGTEGQVLKWVSGAPAWGTASGGGGSVTDVTGTSPIASSGGTTPAISIANAAADGSTKGAASFTANDFNATTGNVSIDYTNGQAASGSVKGFLTSADWTTFNSKIGGSTGATDNAILRADGTGGGTVQSSLASIDDSGFLTLPAGLLATPSLTWGANTGVYSSGSNVVDFAVGSLSRISMLGQSLRIYNFNAATYGFATMSATTKLSLGSTTCCSQTVEVLGAGDMPANLQITVPNVGHGAQTWSHLLSQSNSGQTYDGLYTLENVTDGVTTMGYSKGLGGGVGVTRTTQLSAFTVQPQANVSNIGGTTTVNASTTVTGSSTKFNYRLAPYDMISVSSSASTYRLITAIASDTSLTVDGNLGDGTSQTINVKKGVQRWLLADGTTHAGFIDPLGNFGAGKASLATDASDGFLYVPSGAGTPTGTPSTRTGYLPIYADSSNNKLYLYSGGSWNALN